MQFFEFRPVLKKKKKHIVKSPLCACGHGDIENVYHFFLRCPLYRDQRIDLNNTISGYTALTLNVLLSGDETLPFASNVVIFESAQKYILATKRFDTK